MCAILDALPSAEGDVGGMAHADSGRALLGRWTAGLAVGVVSGLLPLALGTIGLLLAVPGLVWSLADRPRGVAVSGLLAGLGGTWLLVWARASQACGVSTATQGCVGPDVNGLILVPIGLLIVGGLLGMATARPRR